MVLDVVGMVGVSEIILQPNVVYITDWRATQFMLIAEFKLLNLGTKGSLMNIYGPSAFPRKQDLLDFFGWVKDLTEVGNRVVGGDFNLISNLDEN